MELLKYQGYILMERAGGGYRSVIGRYELAFDTASQWKQFIDKRNETREKEDHRY